MLGILLKSESCGHWEERHVEEAEVVEVKSSEAESQSPNLAKHRRFQFQLYTAPSLFPPPQSPLPWGLIENEIVPLTFVIACLR